MPSNDGKFEVDVSMLFDLKGLKAGFKAAAEHALRAIAERLLSDSRIFVPVLTGALKDSGHVEIMPTLNEAISAFRVVYDVSYAERQHEVEYRHPSLGFFGAAKYLEKPLTLFGEFYINLYTFEFDEYVRLHGLEP